jgi:hypothetical protein
MNFDLVNVSTNSSDAQVTTLKVTYWKVPGQYDHMDTITLTNVHLPVLDLSAYGNIIALQFGPVSVASGNRHDVWNMMERHAAQMRTLSTMSF